MTTAFEIDDNEGTAIAVVMGNMNNFMEPHQNKMKLTESVYVCIVHNPVSLEALIPLIG